MKAQDAYRAQYFLACLENEIQRAERAFCHMTCFSGSLYELLVGFCADLLIELDQLVLPTIVHEIHKVKERGLLKGETASNRYISFFVDDNTYTEHAKDVIKHYPFLFAQIDHLIRQTFDNLILCLSRYWKDRDEIWQWLQSSHSTVSKIKPLSSSDRHRNQQSMLICFSCGRKLIYKPVDLSPDRLFSAFIAGLELEAPFNLKTLNVFSKGEYGWIEFIHQEECRGLLEVKNFYCRADALLAIADALNYTDGHCENLIANGEFPILIDNETLFQNYERPVAQQKNILSTMLIQKVTEECVYLNSALQAPDSVKLEYLQTHAINDHTDEIKVRYFGINPSRHHHCPILGKMPYQVKDYVQDVIDGYSHAYDRISDKTTNIMQNAAWWGQVRRVQSRIVIRETMTYAYLLRKIFEPEHISRMSSESVLRQKLGDSIYTNYEVSDLLSLNIPYFYHMPGEKHLYDGRGQRYENAFKESAVEVIQRQFKERSEAKKRFDCEIIARHLSDQITSRDGVA